MPYPVNLSAFADPRLADPVAVLSELGRRRGLGVPRWDHVLSRAPFSGSVVHPVRMAGREFREPFYFVMEKVGGREALHVRPVRGEPWRVADVHGFYGFHAFGDFVRGMPILVVEGISDWAVCSRHYPYVLASLTAWIGHRQAYLLSGLTRTVYIGYDLDEAGAGNSEKCAGTLRRYGITPGRCLPPRDDWGAVWEDPFGRQLIDRQLGKFAKAAMSPYIGRCPWPQTLY
jgi:hypothetical protein